jgi:hypothetical protein
MTSKMNRRRAAAKKSTQDAMPKQLKRPAPATKTPKTPKLEQRLKNIEARLGGNP